MSRDDKKKVPPNSPAHRIRVAMEVAQLDREEVAKLVGVSLATVSAWRNNVYAPEGENLTKLAQVLGVSERHIDYGDDDDNSRVSRGTSPDVLSSHDVGGTIKYFAELYKRMVAQKDEPDEIAKLGATIRELMVTLEQSRDPSVREMMVNLWFESATRPDKKMTDADEPADSAKRLTNGH